MYTRLFSPASLQKSRPNTSEEKTHIQKMLLSAALFLIPKKGPLGSSEHPPVAPTNAAGKVTTTR